MAYLRHDRGPMYDQLLTHRGRIRRFVIEHANLEGWVVKEELDDQVLNRSRYSDWHRVEQAVRMKVSRLQAEGWDLAHASSTNL
ncbi:MAG: hypothetical protein WD690_16240 [Vicinamibacterales bacterium]